MESRFVRPEEHVITISNGDTLVVRKRLSAGERRAKYARLYTQQTTAAADGQFQVVRGINPEQVGLATITAYLLDWSLRDDEGKPVPIRDEPIDQLEHHLNQLAPEHYDEIEKAIESYDEAQAAKKKDDDWRDAVISDIKLAIRCGWRYEWVRDLDADVHEILVGVLIDENDRANR